MNNVKSTKRAFLSSVLATILCFAMLLGTTFAWFTDKVESGNNIITSGNLDIVLEYWDGDSWETVEDKSDILSGNLWEPGYVDVAYLRFKNNGSLNLKYQLGVNIKETPGINQAGENFKLSDYIYFDVVDPLVLSAEELTKAQPNPEFEDSNAAMENATETTKISAGYSKAGKLAAGTKQAPAAFVYLAMVVYMPTSVGNVANHNGVDIPTIDLGINILATQDIGETNGFGENDYDEDAWVDGMKIFSAQDLQAAINAGETNLVIEEDIELTEPIVIPAPVATTYSLRSTPSVITIDLQGNDLTLPEDKLATTYAIQNFGNLILKDSVGGGSVNARGIYNGYDAVTGTIYPNATITVLSGVYNAWGTDGGAAIYNYGILNIENGEFNSNGGYGLNNQAGATLTINNATVNGGIYNKGTLTVADGVYNQHLSGKHCIYNWSGNVTIEGGSFDSQSGNELILADGQDAVVTITGGSFNKTAKSWLFGAATGKNIEFTISGGIFNGYVNDSGSVDTIRPYNDPITVSGGVFNFDPTNWLVEDLEAFKNADGKYIITSDEYEGVIYNVDQLTQAAANGGEYLLLADLQLAQKVTIPSGVEVTLDLNDKTIAGTMSGTGNQDLFLVNGNLTVKNGNIELTATQNQGWGAMSAIFDITAGGVVTLDKVVAENKGGTDMNFVAHLNNWGTATLNVTDSTLKATYVAVRVFNSGYDMNNVTITNSTLSTAGNAAFWVHNYTAADFGTQEKADEQAKLLNFKLEGNTYIANKAAFRYGMTNAVYYNADGNIVVNSAKELQTILDAAQGECHIVFVDNIIGDVTITQKEGVNITLDGNGKTFNGVMTVFGDGRQNEAETLTIQNIHFVAKEGADSCIVSPDRTLNNKYSYAHNVTVKNCTFTDPDGVVGCAAIRHEDGGDKNWTIIGCTVDATMHSLIQTNNVEGKLIINGCTVESKNGANLNSCTNVEIDGCTFDVKGYAVRFGVGSGGNLGVAKTFEIKNSTLKSECNDGDAIIIFRASAVDAVLNINDTTLTGKTQFAGQTAKTVIKIDGAQISAFVGTAEDLLEALSSLKTTGAVVLNCDIDLTGVLWDVTMPWTGSNTTITIDGQGHTIKGLTTQGERGGLLGKLSTNGNVVIKNLKFEDVTIIGTGTDSECAGGALIGWYENHGGAAIIENVHVTNVTASNFKYSGGLIGYTSTDGLEIRDCSVNGGKIESINHVGGLVGYLSNAAANTTSTVKNCSLEALEVKTVNSTKNREGAVVGTMQAGCAIDRVTIKNVTVMGAAATIEKVVGVVNLGTVTNITIQ